MAHVKFTQCKAITQEQRVGKRARREERRGEGEERRIPCDGCRDVVGVIERLWGRVYDTTRCLDYNGVECACTSSVAVNREHQS